MIQRRSFLTLMGATAAAASTGTLAVPAAAENKKFTIALVPGLTTDAFYITMHRGAQAAAEALGQDLLFQGASEWNVTLQVPVLDAVIAGKFQTGSGDADFPISYIASDNVLGGRMAARALAKAIGEKGKVYVSNVKPGVSTTDQREEGFKDEMKSFPGIEVLETQFNDDDANKAASQVQAVFGRTPDLAGVFGANLFSATGSANGVKQAGQAGKIKIAAFDAPQSVVEELKNGTFEIAIAQHPAEIGYFGVVSAFAHLTGNPVPTAIGTGFTVMTKDNIDDPNVAKYLYTG